MDARIAEHARLTVGTVKCNEPEPHYLCSQGLCRLEFFTRADGVPKIHIHRVTQLRLFDFEKYFRILVYDHVKPQSGALRIFQGNAQACVPGRLVIVSICVITAQALSWLMKYKYRHAKRLRNRLRPPGEHT